MADTKKKTNTKGKAQPGKEVPEEDGMSGEAVILIGAAAAVFLELSNFGLLGTVGGWLRTAGFGLFGIMTYVFPVLIVLCLVFYAFLKTGKITRIICAALIFFFAGAIVHQAADAAYEEAGLSEYFGTANSSLSGGGLLCGALAKGLNAAFGTVGLYIISGLVCAVCLLIIADIFKIIRKARAKAKENKKEKEERQPETKKSDAVFIRPEDSSSGRHGRGMRSRYKEKEVYKTQEEGTVIRIVDASSSGRKNKIQRAQMQRSNNKAPSMRSEAADGLRTRSLTKVKGISSDITLKKTAASRDEVHEITNIKAEYIKPEIRASENKPVQTIQVRDPEEITFRTDENQQGGRERKSAAGTGNMPQVSQEEAALKTPRADKNASGKGSGIKEMAPGGMPDTRNSAKAVSGEGRFTASKSENGKKNAGSRSRAAGSVAVPLRNAASVAENAGQDFDLPPLSILGKKRQRASGTGEDIEKTAKNLEYVLEQFGVCARVVNVQVGPSVTRYELQPEMGTKVSKFTSLADDLRLNLAVAEIRIEAPVPGKNVVGIEIPNGNVQPVTLRELLEAPELAGSKSKLAFAAGRSISGEVIVGDIAAMPHLLIAGTTGSGKSVFTKSIIMEILYRARPDEVGLIVIDPKKVEFNVFEGIPHLMKSVVTDPGQAVSTLRWAVNEMMIRYDRMNKSGVNNIKSYNAKVERGQISETEEKPEKMPQIVIVIDELADLMMVAKKEVESYICRLAQLSRAAGIHMVIATQRPSADVVTGLIKSNIPSRVALKVASGIDSRVILDSMGAEKLLGKGDMLFYPSGFASPVRVQGAFVTDKEVSDTVRYLTSHNSGGFYAAKENEIEEFINSSASEGAESVTESAEGENKYDEFFHDAGLLCIEMGRASSSMLQRRFNIGFNRAARIIDQLAEFGVTGPANGSKPREILMDSMTFEDMYAETVKGQGV